MDVAALGEGAGVSALRIKGGPPSWPEFAHAGCVGQQPRGLAVVDAKLALVACHGKHRTVVRDEGPDLVELPHGGGAAQGCPPQVLGMLEEHRGWPREAQSRLQRLD